MLEKNENEIMKNWSLADEPTVSILCPAYNHEDHIEEALDSFLMQETNFPFEVIVQDDVSTDNTANIIKAYAEKYPQIIKPIFQRENQYSKGPTRIMIPLFEKAKGKYHALCEGDDYWIDSNKLQIQIDLMEKEPECHISFHSAEIRLDKDEHGELYAKRADGNKIFSTSEVILGGGGFCPTSSVIFRKDAVSNIPSFFNDAPIGDYFLQILGSLNGGALYINRVMSVYRKGIEGSWSSSMSNIEKRKAFYHNIIDTFDSLDIYTDNKYNKEITEMKSKQHYGMAMEYFEKNMVKQFQETIECSYNLYKINSISYLIFYNFRHFPILLNFLKEIYKFKPIRDKR